MGRMEAGTLPTWLRILDSRACSLWAAGLVALSALLVSAHLGWATGYRDYAVALTARPPAGAEVRPDIEAYLDRLADAYRKAKDRGGLLADDLMRIAARAQAIDMMLAGRSGHTSRTGLFFDGRFGSFVGNVELFRARGENAASDRSRKPPDEAKARHLFELWLASSQHRRNLMNRNYAFVSSGVIQRGNELW